MKRKGEKCNAIEDGESHYAEEEENPHSIIWPVETAKAGCKKHEKSKIYKGMQSSCKELVQVELLLVEIANGWK